MAIKASTLYIDESGSRLPDNEPGQVAPHGRDWFSIGGVLINDEDEDQARADIAAFRSAWPQLGEAPLHSHEIRSRQKNFLWLEEDEGVAKRFLDELTALMLSLPVIGISCVIDRPGYNARYKELYKENRWQLCKTAFAIAVERATKLCQERDRKLRVYVERSGKTEERMLKSYYDTLKQQGHWFNETEASRYAPLEAAVYAKCLYEFRVKHKTSPLMTIADLYLWPMCIGGYHLSNKPYQALKAAGKLIDSHVKPEEVLSRGIKYSCFENVKRTS